MKLFTFGVAIVLSSATVGFAQRTTGNTRPGGEGPHSGSGDRPPRSQPATDNPPPSPAPPSSGGGGGGAIVVWFPSPPPVIILEPPVMVEESPEAFKATMLDSEGCDFSAEEICSQGNKHADVFFSHSNDGPEFVVGNDVDIQSMGRGVSFANLESPANEWSPSHRVLAEAHNVYVVWTWDNQFYKFRVVSLTDERVAIEWLPLDGGRRRAARDDDRNGNVRFAGAEKMFGR